MNFDKRLLIFIFFQIYMMGLVFVSWTTVRVVLLATLFLAVMLSWKRWESAYRKPLTLFFIFTTINMISCYIMRGQTPAQFVQGTEFINILGIFVLFSIPCFKIEDWKVEKTLIVMATIFIFCYFIQYLIYPLPIFIRVSDEIDLMDFVNARPRIPGQALLSLAFFYYMEKTMEKFNIFYVLLAALALICLVIMGFRSQMAVLAVMSVVFLISYIKLSGRMIMYIVFLVVGLFILSQTSIVQNKIAQMEQRSEVATFSDENYIRIRTMEHFIDEEPKNMFEKVMGIGLPGVGPYGVKMLHLKAESGIVWADWGLIGLAWVLGYPAVLCLVWYVLKAFFMKTDKRHYYLRFWLLFLMLGSTLTREFYRDGAFAIQGIVLYLIARYHRQYMAENPMSKKYGL
jgi:hypothetical protein